MKSLTYRFVGISTIALASLSLTGCGGSGSAHNSTGAAPSVTTSTTSTASSSSTTMSSTATNSPTSSTKAVTSSSAATTDKAAPKAVKAPTTALPHTTVAAPKVTQTKKPVAAPPAAVLPAGTVCYSTKDPNTGHPAWTATAGKNVSKVFCANVAKAAIDGSNAGGTFNVQAVGSSGKEITMSCQTFDTGMKCTGGTDAEVDLGLNTGF